MFHGALGNGEIKKGKYIGNSGKGIKKSGFLVLFTSFLSSKDFSFFGGGIGRGFFLGTGW